MAEAILSVVGGRITSYSGHHNAITVTDPEGREWKAMSDGSLRNGAEFVTPVLKWENIELLQAIIRAIRHAGAKTPATRQKPPRCKWLGWDVKPLMKWEYEPPTLMEVAMKVKEHLDKNTIKGE